MHRRILLSLSKNNIALLIGIAVVAISLSILSFQYYAAASTKIAEIAADDIRLNTKVQAHALSTVLEGKIDSVRTILDTLTLSIPVQDNNVDVGKGIIERRQQSTSEITDFYLWLDKDGKVLWSSAFSADDDHETAARARELYENADLSKVTIIF